MRIIGLYLSVNPTNRISILNYGSKYYMQLIENCKYNFIKNVIQNWQTFFQEFVTNPDAGDHRFIFHLTVHNSNIGVKSWKDGNFFTPEYYGWYKNLQISINELYEMQHFISFKKFKSIINEKNRQQNIGESTYLKFKRDIKSMYGPVDTKIKYPPAIPNTNLKPNSIFCLEVSFK